MINGAALSDELLSFTGKNIKENNQIYTTTVFSVCLHLMGGIYLFKN